MKIERVEIVNFKGIAGRSESLDGNSVYVTGANGAGKSSFIDAIFTALTGKNTPSEPIKKGKTEGKVEIDLGDGCAVIVEYKETKGKVKQTLTFVEDGVEVKESPRARLNAKVGTVDFNPFEFMQKTPKEKLDYFLKISGTNTTDIDTEYKENNELINLETKELNRTELLPFDEELAALEEKPAAQVINEIAEATKKNAAIEDFEKKLGALVQRGVEIKAEIERLTDELGATTDSVEKGQKWLSKQQKIDIEPLTKAAESLDETNANIRAAKSAKEGNDKREKLQENIDLATEANKKLRKKKEDLINKALKGVPGVTFDGEQFLLDGLPFEPNQGNTSAQIIAGLGIGLKMLGEIRIARFDGSLLDKEHLSSVEKWASENDLQLFVELVDRSGESGLKLEIIES